MTLVEAMNSMKAIGCSGDQVAAFVIAYESSRIADPRSAEAKLERKRTENIRRQKEFKARRKAKAEAKQQ